ncbi:hypothetical protein [Vibrio cholerae]|uniref:hypothetical protein n=1 Tax=Vibrio cholerae TaxID=666 RepID=UPI00163B6ADF|nr:hypothetical protein [Vibrio cholerae]
MNPIDKITEPSFTSSTRGLLTLFCIGIFHIVIGIDLSNSKIAIPWFPVVELKNIERLIYLYWGLVFLHLIDISFTICLQLGAATLLLLVSFLRKVYLGGNLLVNTFLIQN